MAHALLLSFAVEYSLNSWELYGGFLPQCNRWTTLKFCFWWRQSPWTWILKRSQTQGGVTVSFNNHLMFSFVLLVNKIARVFVTQQIQQICRSSFPMPFSSNIMHISHCHKACRDIFFLFFHFLLHRLAQILSTANVNFVQGVLLLKQSIYFQVSHHASFLLSSRYRAQLDYI